LGWRISDGGPELKPLQQRPRAAVRQQGAHLRDDPLVLWCASVGHDLGDRAERLATGHRAPAWGKARRADFHRAEQRHQSARAQIFERPLHAAPLAASPAAAMVLRLCFDKMALHRREHMLALRQRQPTTAAPPLTS
jgi:hypothetical protein